MSQNPSKETHFRIAPKVSLKKDGEVVSYRDFFTLTCPTNMNSIGFIERNSKALEF